MIQDTVSDAVFAVGDRVYSEIICDSLAVHVKPANPQMASLHGAREIILDTDSTITCPNPADFSEIDI